MAENNVTYSASRQTTTTILVLFFLLAILIILLFFMYKHLNMEARGKYTIRRIVYREGGLRDRTRGMAVALGNRLGVQLWPESDVDQDEETGEGEEEEDEEGQVNSNGNENEEDSDEDDMVQANEQKNDQDSVDPGERESKRGSSSEENSVDSSDEEDPSGAQLETVVEKTEEQLSDVQQKSRTTSGPIVINMNQFSGSVLWAEEDGAGDINSDVTAL